MSDLTIVGEILKKRAENLSDESIARQLHNTRGIPESSIDEALQAIEEDTILVVKSIAVFTPVSPITYRFGVKKIEKEVRPLWGLFRDTTELAVKTIDRVMISRTLVSAKVIIVHSNQNQIIIDKITPSDAEKVRQMYCDIIEAQRKSIINITED